MSFSSRSLLVPCAALVLALGAACSDEGSASPDAGLGGAPGDAGQGNTEVVDAAPPVDAGPDAEVDPFACVGELIPIASPGAHQDIQPALQEAVEGAVPGDCLLLPQGEFAVDDTVAIDRGVSLYGHGRSAAGTVLYRRDDLDDDLLGYGRMVRYQMTAADPCDVLIKGIYFRGKTPSVTAGDGGSLAPDTGLGFNECTGFQVTQCRFENFGYGGVLVEHADDLARGLIYDNEFFHNVKGPTALGLGYGVAVYGTNDEWVTDPQFGSNNFIFIEDNHFEEHRHSVAGGGAGRYVFRNNEVLNNLWGHAIDAHEARGSGSNTYSTRAVEAYGNHVANTKFRDGSALEPGHDLNDLVGWAIMFRGGEGLVYSNRIEGYLIALGVTSFVHEFPAQYPIPTQIGYQSALDFGASHSGTDAAHAAGDLFYWDNTYTVYQAGEEWREIRNSAPEYLQEDRDFHIGTAKPGYAAYPYPHPDRQ